MTAVAVARLLLEQQAGSAARERRLRRASGRAGARRAQSPGAEAEPARWPQGPPRWPATCDGTPGRPAGA